MRISIDGRRSLAPEASGNGRSIVAVSRRNDQGGTRRLALLVALEALFLREGFEHLTVNELARRLQCSKTTLYSLAPSKEQIVIVVVKHFFRQAAATIENSLLNVEGPRERIAAYLNGVGTAMRRGSTAFVDDMTNYPPTARIYRNNSQVAAERVSAMILEGVQAGVFREVHATFAAQVVTRAINGIQSGELLETTGLSSGDAFSELAELLVHGLTAR